MSSLASVRPFCRLWAVQVRSNLIVGLVALVLLATGSAPAFAVDPPPPIVVGSPLCRSGGACLDLQQPDNRLGTLVGPVNVHLVFWLPEGYHFNPDAPTDEGDAAYQRTIEQFMRDLDGSAYYNIISQYYNGVFGYSPNRLTVYSHVETRPFPPIAGGLCRSAFPDAELCQSDVESAVQFFWEKHNLANRFSPLPGGGFSSNVLTDVMLVYTPAEVQVCTEDVLFCSGDYFAGYNHHIKYRSDSGDLIFAPYAVMPMNPLAPSAPSPSPNGRYVDPVISTSAHEMFEKITDPIGFGWLSTEQSSAGAGQIGNFCRYLFGPIIDPQTGANMVLNGHPYLVQYMFSNAQGGCTNAFYGQFINFDKPPDVPYGSPPFPVEADATSELELTFTANGACSVTSDGTVTLTTPGVCTITAFQDGNQSSGGFYKPATPVTQSFTVTPGTPCAAGSYSTTGFEPCTPAPAGSYAAGPGNTSASLCPAGTYQPNSGQTSCLPASPGNFVAGTGQTAQMSCPMGRYQPNSGQISCLAADPGHFVAGTEQTAQTSCEPGSYQPNSGQTSCLAADPGHFVAGTRQVAQTSCEPGSYQPNSGQTSCISASPGYYVAAAGASAQEQCPVGYTSPAGATACTLTLFNFTGFFAPVDNPPLVNTLKAGSAVPVKFSLGGNRGLTIFAAGYPKSQPIACNTGSPTDSIEETVTAGGSTLTYDATTDQYKYVWKTDKTWKGCRQLILQFTDGTTKIALFEFK